MAQISNSTQSPPIPAGLKNLLPYPQTPWIVSSTLFSRINLKSSELAYKVCEVLVSEPEFDFIAKYFENHKPPGYSIKKVVCIHNPDHTKIFEIALKNMERETSNPFFAPKGKNEAPEIDRQRVLARWEAQVAEFSPLEIKTTSARQPDVCTRARVLPLWHGSSIAVCQSICSDGYTSFGKHHYFNENAKKGGSQSTDKGYFGSGIYFTNSARYAAMYSSEGQLLLTWVSMREPYPVVNDIPHPHKGSDMIKLEGKEHYQNYNAHFVPVASIRPEDPKCIEYYPCYKDQLPAWDEFVVFYPTQALPRFWVELGVDFPKVTPSNLTTVGTFLSLLLELVDKSEVKKYPPLVKSLRSRVDYLLNLPENSQLKVEDERFFKLVKRLFNENGQISSSVLNLVLAEPGFTTSFTPPKSSSPSGNEEYLRGFSQQKKGEFIQAFTSFQKAAELGHAEAQFALSRCYKRGEGVIKDEAKSIEWCQKAAKQGHLVAQGNCFYFGYGKDKNLIEAANLYKKAAEQGDAIAQYN